MKKKITLIHGPNLNLLGKRDPALYGSLRLPELEEAVRSHAATLGFELVCIQSNLEGELVNAVQNSEQESVGLIINPGGYSHTSVAIRDAVEAISIPAIEVHLSNIHAREPYRRVSLTASAALSCVSGLGVTGYLAALDHLHSVAQSTT